MEQPHARVGEYIDKYIQLRDRMNEIKDRHKQELAPYNDAMLKLENFFQKVMDDTGLENLKSEKGTAYKTTQSSVTVADWDAFRDYVVENQAWYLLEHRASKKAVEEVLEDSGDLPPGLNINRTLKVNVRRS